MKELENSKVFRPIYGEPPKSKIIWPGAEAHEHRVPNPLVPINEGTSQEISHNQAS